MDFSRNFGKRVWKKNKSRLYKEEEIARSLYTGLTEFYADSDLNPFIGVDGAGVHWNCKISLNDYSISIKCCDTSYLQGISGDEEFIVSFYHKEKEVSCGRTFAKEEVISSSNTWIRSCSKQLLYKRFEFVDKGLRKAEQLEQNWLISYPELRKARRSIQNYGSGGIRYEISYGNRLCFFNSFGEVGNPHMSFLWDQHILFTIETVPSQLAEVLTRFLIDQEAPSSLQKDFPWIPTNELTKGFEAGIGLEAICTESWKYMLNFYTTFPNQRWLDKEKIIAFTQELIDLGFNKKVRASQSVTRLILSPSKIHGIMGDNPYIALSFKYDKIHIKTSYWVNDKIINLEVNEELLSLIKRLESEKID